MADINVGELSEAINDKVDTANMEEVRCVVDSYINGTEWYRIWSDGWCEQGGMIYLNTAGTVTYLQPYLDTNYTITVSSQRTSNNGFVRISELTATTVTMYFEWDTGQSKSGYGRWYTCGYIS